MQERFIFTFLFHLFGISLVLIPDRFQGPVLQVVSGIPLRLVDGLAIVLIIAGTVYLFSWLILCLKREKAKLDSLRAQDPDLEKTEQP